MTKSLAVLVSTLFLSATLISQTSSTIVSGDNVGYSGSNNGKCLVKDSNGTLWLARMAEPVLGTRTIVIDASFDSGATWGTAVFNGINDANSGETTLPLVGQVSMAIDDQDNLHIVWNRGSSAQNFYNQYYCQVNTTTLAVTPYIDLKATFGISSSTRTGANGVAVDAAGTVWVLMSSTTNWRAQLLMSDTPYASSMTFTSVGQVSTAASAQNARLAVDLAGKIHCVYYENTGSGDFRHRAYDPVAGSWGSASDLGNLSPTNDYTGSVVCDYAGNTHIISLRDAAGSGSPSFVYYLLDAAGTLSAPITIMTATNAQLSGIANQHIIDMACDEFTGDVYVVFRDLSNGAELACHFLPSGGTAFTPLFQLAPANAGQHYYYAPRLRGTLFPASNNTGTNLHFTWREMWPAPYDYKFFGLVGTQPPTAAYPGNGTDARIDVRINGTPDFQITNQHTVGAGDAVGLTFSSPQGSLTTQPFLALSQIFTTGSPATPLLLPGDSAASVWLDLTSPISVLVDGLSNPGTFLNPILDDYDITGAIPASVGGQGISAMILLLVSDPGLNPVNLGSADAHELVIP